jgi:hypothetical protein
MARKRINQFLERAEFRGIWANPNNLHSSLDLEDQPTSTGNNHCSTCGVSAKDRVDYCSMGECYKTQLDELQNPGRLAD